MENEEFGNKLDPYGALWQVGKWDFCVGIFKNGSLGSQIPQDWLFLGC